MEDAVFVTTLMHAPVTPTTISQSIEIHVPRELAMRLWLDCGNFPKYMRGIVAVQRVTPTRLHWRAEQWGEVNEWESEVEEDVETGRISWRVLPDGHVRGEVTFKERGPEDVLVTHAMILDQIEDGERGLVRSRLQDDLQRFREFAEGQE